MWQTRALQRHATGDGRADEKYGKFRQLAIWRRMMNDEESEVVREWSWGWGWDGDQDWEEDYDQDYDQDQNSDSD